MADALKPTKNRLALLRAVFNVEVYEATSTLGEVYSVWDHGRPSMVAGRYQRVTASINELCRAGWVRVDSLSHYNDQRYWDLTDAGRAILDGAS